MPLVFSAQTEGLRNTFAAAPRLTARHVASTFNRIRRDMNRRVVATATFDFRRQRGAPIQSTIFVPAARLAVSRRLNRGRRRLASVQRGRPNEFSLLMSLSRLYRRFQTGGNIRARSSPLPLPAEEALTPRGQVKARYRGKTPSRVRQLNEDTVFVPANNQGDFIGSINIMRRRQLRPVLNLFSNIRIDKSLFFFESFDIARTSYLLQLRGAVDRVRRDLERGRTS